MAAGALSILPEGDSDGMPPHASRELLHASLLALVACPDVAALEQYQRVAIALERSHYRTGRKQGASAGRL